MAPEERKNFFLLPAYYHHIIGSPGIAGVYAIREL
jgi:hypothetical protein